METPETEAYEYDWKYVFADLAKLWTWNKSKVRKSWNKVFMPQKFADTLIYRINDLHIVKLSQYSTSLA